MEDIIREIKKYFDQSQSDNVAWKNWWAQGEPLWSKTLRQEGLKTRDLNRKDSHPRDKLNLKLVVQRK